MNWISVNDRLPEKGKVVLLYQAYTPNTMFNAMAYPLESICFISVGGLRYDGKFVLYVDQFAYTGLKYVTHWMPLPEPPKF